MMYPVSGLFKKYKEKIVTIISGLPILRIYDVNTKSHTDKDLPIAASSGFYNQFIIDSLERIHYINKDRNISIVHLKDLSKHKMIRLPNDAGIKASSARVFEFTGSEYYIGTRKNGFAIYDSKSGAIKAQYNTNSDPPLSSDFVNTIVEEKEGIIWLGTLGGGVNRIDRPSNSIKVIVGKDGLPNNMIASMIDTKEHLWIGTYGGLSRMNKWTFSVNNYFVSDGLPNNEFNYLSTYKSLDGNLHMGTFNGLIKFDPEKVVGKGSLPAAQLVAIQKFNRRKNELIRQEFGLSEVREISLSPYDNYLHLEFAVPQYSNAGSYRYYIQFKDRDEDWREIGQNPFIRFQQLAPDQYELWVKAADSNDNESIEPLIIHINARQFFFKSWWFILGCIMLLGGLVYVLYRYRVKLLRKEMATRTRIASDLHDEIGSSLTRVSLQMQLMEATDKNLESNGGKLNQLSNIIDQAANKLRDVVWSIDARNDSWENVISRMVDYASDTLNPKDIHFTFKKEGININENIPVAWKQNLYLIYKEAINNIARHSNATKVDIILTKDTFGKCNLIVQDNGLQSMNNKQVKGQGLQNIKLRAHRMKGKVFAGFNDIGFCVKLNI